MTVLHLAKVAVPSSNLQVVLYVNSCVLPPLVTRGTGNHINQRVVIGGWE
jgi:hypothetical protein